MSLSLPTMECVVMGPPGQKRDDEMPVWKATPVSATPVIVLSRYGVFRTDRREVHFCGYNMTEGEGRVSSPVVSFNRRTRVAKTRSGRQYRLEGPPGFDPEALYVMRAWLSINSVVSYVDVTTVLLEKGLKAATTTPLAATPPAVH